MSDTMRLQVSIGGYVPPGGTADAVTVVGELDLGTGALLVAIARTVKPGQVEKRVPGAIVTTNNAATEDRDALFTDQDLRDAIDAYFDLAGRGLLVLDGSAERMNPSNKIEPDGLDERGRKYRFAPDIGNGQVAVLAMCWMARRQAGHQLVADSMDDYTDLQELHSIGIGAPPDRQARYIMGGQIRLGPDGWPE